MASEYNSDYVGGLLEHFQREMRVIAPGSTLTTWRVPGAFEIPLAVQEVASRGGIDAVVALGVIIEGRTAHASLIGTAITGSLLRISLDSRVPIIHEVLLLQDAAQAEERCMAEKLNRGTEAARVAVRMVEAMQEIRNER